MNWQSTPGEIKPWLDVQKGLERFGGNREIYARILRAFAASIRSLFDIVTGVTEDNLASYAITVHGIKGASRSIYADQTGDMAEALEKAAKAGDFDFVLAHNQDFIKNIENLVAHVDGMLEEMASKKSTPKKNRPDIETLTKLLTACKNYDMDGVDAAIAEIEKYEYESDDGLTAWLRANVEQMNFTQIEEKLSALIGAVE